MATYDDVKWHISNGLKPVVKEYYEHLNVLRHLMIQGHMDDATLQAFRSEEARLVGLIQQIFTDEIEAKAERVRQLGVEAGTLTVLRQEVGQPFNLPPPLP